jgi:hypothetical protein
MVGFVDNDQLEGGDRTFLLEELSSLLNPHYLPCRNDATCQLEDRSSNSHIIDGEAPIRALLSAGEVLTPMNFSDLGLRLICQLFTTDKNQDP